MPDQNIEQEGWNNRREVRWKGVVMANSSRTESALNLVTTRGLPRCNAMSAAPKPVVAVFSHWHLASTGVKVWLFAAPRFMIPVWSFKLSNHDSGSDLIKSGTAAPSQFI